MGPADHEVTTSSGVIRYRDVGDGPPLLFFHAVLLNGAFWRKVVDLLCADFRCIVPDWPMGGHAVPVDDDADLSLPGLAGLAVEVIDGLGLERVTIVGNDTGGAICQVLAAEHPERVEAMVVTDCDAYEDCPPRLVLPIFWLGRTSAGLRAMAAVLRLRFLWRTPLAFGLMMKSRPDREVVEGYIRPLRSDPRARRDAAKVFRGADRSVTLAAAERLRSFPRPVLVAWAPKDRVFKFRNGERLAREIPGARLERIEDSLAFVAEDQPERVADLIRTFVREQHAA